MHSKSHDPLLQPAKSSPDPKKPPIPNASRMATPGKIEILERLLLDSVEHYPERTNQTRINRLSTEILDYTDGLFELSEIRHTRYHAISMR